MKPTLQSRNPTWSYRVLSRAFVAWPSPSFSDVRQCHPFCSLASVDLKFSAPQGASFDHGGGITLIRRGPDLESGVEIEGGAAASKPTPSRLIRYLPFSERLTCTVEEACEVTGLGRTKIYELIQNGRLNTTTEVAVG
jgi:hypothetical protein